MRKVRGSGSAPDQQGHPSGSGSEQASNRGRLRGSTAKTRCPLSLAGSCRQHSPVAGGAEGCPRDPLPFQFHICLAFARTKDRP